MDEEPLFELDERWLRARRGRAADLTQRQSWLLSMRLHPLSLKLRRTLKLHVFGSRARCPCERGRVSPRVCPTHAVLREEPRTTCGNCVHLGKLDYEPPGAPNRSPLKCWFGNGARVSRGDVTTVRRWWPACADHELRGDRDLSLPSETPAATPSPHP